MIYNNNNNTSSPPSSISATPPVIEIYFLIGNDSTPRELSPLFPLLLPLWGEYDILSISSGYRAIYYPTPQGLLCPLLSLGTPLHLSTSRCCLSPLLPLLPRFCYSLA